MVNPEILIKKRNPKDLVEERDPIYGRAWWLTSTIIHKVGLRDAPLFRTAAVFPWIMILNKLMRTLVTPSARDHWDDIQGYAQLVIDYLDAGVPDD